MKRFLDPFSLQVDPSDALARITLEPINGAEPVLPYIFIYFHPICTLRIPILREYCVHWVRDQFADRVTSCYILETVILWAQCITLQPLQCCCRFGPARRFTQISLIQIFIHTGCSRLFRYTNEYRSMVSGWIWMNQRVSYLVVSKTAILLPVIPRITQHLCRVRMVDINTERQTPISRWNKLTRLWHH